MTEIENKFGILSIYDYIQILEDFGVESTRHDAYLRRSIGYRFLNDAIYLNEIVEKEKTKGSIRNMNKAFRLLYTRSEHLISGK